jgi:hypothetical protein
MLRSFVFSYPSPPVQVISLETNHAGEVFPGSQREVREYLEGKGYVLAGTVGEDSPHPWNCYYNANLRDRRYLRTTRSVRGQICPGPSRRGKVSDATEDLS